MTSADAGPRSRVAWRPVRDVAIPIGDLSVVNAARRLARWRTTLRLGVMPRPARRSGADDAPDRRPVGAGDVVDHGSVLLPILCFEPCLHRHVRRSVLLDAYGRYVETGAVDVTFSELWTFGDLAVGHLVPAPRTAKDWAPTASGKKAAAYESELRDDDAAGLAGRRLLQRHPFALLSPALHLTRAGTSAPADQPAAFAAVEAFAKLLATAELRGQPDALQVPDPDVDLLHRFPRRRSGPQAARNPKRFVSLLGLEPWERTAADREDHLRREQELTKELKSWRAKTVRAKAKPWAVPDLEVGHALVDQGEHTLDDGLLVTWAITFVARSPSVRALMALADASPFLEWTPSPWLRGDEPRPIHRVRVRGRTPEELDEIARMYVRGAPWAVDGREDAVVGYVVGGSARGVVEELPIPAAIPLEIEVDTFG